jgi:hypothetical protein
MPSISENAGLFFGLKANALLRNRDMLQAVNADQSGFPRGSHHPAVSP